jgi:tetrahydromethanopterin S-methyltransferase subunit D
MTITKYSAMLSIVILITGIVVATASLFVNVEAFKDPDFKKIINSKKCTNFNLNVNGELIKTINRGDPICINHNSGQTSD